MLIEKIEKRCNFYKLYKYRWYINKLKFIYLFIVFFAIIIIAIGSVSDNTLIYIGIGLTL
jgi:hypothetical protein